MTHLKYAVIGTNLWAVMRGDVKVGEIAANINEGRPRFIPAESYAFTPEELSGITGFMLRQLTLFKFPKMEGKPLEVKL